MTAQPLILAELTDAPDTPVPTSLPLHYIQSRHFYHCINSETTAKHAIFTCMKFMQISQVG